MPIRFFDRFRASTLSPGDGSVVYCNLAGGVEHSGIHVGNGLIAHLDGSGGIELVSPRQFLGRLGGSNPAKTIYIACDGECGLTFSAAAQRARKMVGKRRNYNILMDNCHQFTAGCITGDFDASINFMWMLTDVIEKRSVDSICWRPWDRRMMDLYEHVAHGRGTLTAPTAIRTGASLKRSRKTKAAKKKVATKPTGLPPMI